MLVRSRSATPPTAADLVTTLEQALIVPVVVAARWSCWSPGAGSGWLHSSMHGLDFAATGRKPVHLPWAGVATVALRRWGPFTELVVTPVADDFAVVRATAPAARPRLRRRAGEVGLPGRRGPDVPRPGRPARRTAPPPPRPRSEPGAVPGCAVPGCAVPGCAVLCRAALCRAALCRAALCRAALCRAALCRAALCRAALCRAALCRAALCRAALSPLRRAGCVGGCRSPTGTRASTAAEA